MRISDILSWNNEPPDRNRSDPQLHLPPAPFSNLQNAFTRSGLVKHFWNLNGSGGQPSGPAPPDAETELIPRGTSEPTTASINPSSRHSSWAGIPSAYELTSLSG